MQPVFTAGQRDLGAANLNKMSRGARGNRKALSYQSKGMQGPTGVIAGGGRAAVAGARFPWHRLALGYSKVGPFVTIYPGAIRQHGLVIYKLSASQTVELTGSTEWVYAHVNRHASPGAGLNIFHSATEPETNSSDLRIPLFSFVAISAGVYGDPIIHNMGDVNFDTPM